MRRRGGGEGEVERDQHERDGGGGGGGELERERHKESRKREREKEREVVKVVVWSELPNLSFTYTSTVFLCLNNIFSGYLLYEGVNNNNISC